MALRHLPNALTALRIVLLPLWIALVVVQRDRALDALEVHRAPLLVFGFLLGLTDVVDGIAARALQVSSNFGAALDAVADKLAQQLGVTLLTFFAVPAYTPLPLWLWATVVARDVLIGTGWLTVRLHRGAVHVEHRWHGKVATWLLFMLVLGSVAALPQWLINATSALTCALIVPGTLAYLRAGVRQLAS
jgi:phosphatidylglycerophosphate synthase